MNLAQTYVNIKETKEYYQIRPKHITAALNPYYGSYIVYAKPSDLYCGMTPEKFRKIVTDGGALRHTMDNNNVPVFYEQSDCETACRLLHIYLYHRDYKN